MKAALAALAVLVLGGWGITVSAMRPWEPAEAAPGPTPIPTLAPEVERPSWCPAWASWGKEPLPTGEAWACTMGNDGVRILGQHPETGCRLRDGFTWCTSTDMERLGWT